MKKQAVKRNRRRAMAWLVLHGIRQADIVRELQQRNKTQVNHTLLGMRSDRLVLRHLINIGCPEEYLDLPADMQRKAL